MKIVSSLQSDPLQDAAIAAMNTAADHARRHIYGGFLYGDRHVIRDFRKSAGEQDIWSVEGGAYQDCHDRMTAEIERLNAYRAALVPGNEKPHETFRREAFDLAATLDPSKFAGDVENGSGIDTVAGLARTLAIIAGGYDWTVGDDGRLYACISGDQGFAATGILVDAIPAPPVPEKGDPEEPGP